MKVKPGAIAAPLPPPKTPQAPAAATPPAPAPPAIAAPTDGLDRAVRGLEEVQTTSGTVWQYHAPPMSEAPGKGVTVNWDGVNAAAGSGTVNAARAQGSAGVTSGAVSGTINVSEGQNEVWAGYQPPGVTGAPTFSAILGSWNGALAVGVNATGKLDGVSGSASLYGTVDRSLNFLGVYQGSDPALKDTYQVEVKREMSTMGIFNLSTLAGTLGLAGGLTPTGSRATRFRSHVPKELARTLALEPKGVVGYLRNKARAASLVKEPLPLPRLDQPEKLKVGDEVGVRTVGALSIGVAAGSFGFPIGAQVTAKGEFELEVKKTAATLVEVTVTPVRLKGALLSAGLPLVGDMGAQVGKAVAVSQSFTFDVSVPEGRAAYLLALKGELPGQLRREDGASAAASIRGEQLPAGVTRRFADLMSATHRTVGAAVSLAFVQRGGPVGGLGTYFSAVSGTRSITDGTTLASFEHRDVQRRSELLLSGTERTGVRATRRTVTTFDAQGTPSSSFGGVRLVATFSDDKVRGLEFNGDVVDSVNKLFGLEAKPMERKRQGQSWQLTLGRTLGEAELAALAKPSEERLAAAAATGVSRKALEGFTQAMRGETSAEGRAERVLEFISQAGMPGFGAVHALLDGEAKALELTRDTNAYSAPLQELERFTLVHPPRFEAAEGAKVLEQRFGEATKLSKTLEEALADLGDDPFPSTDTQALRARLEAGMATGKAAVAVTHLTPQERRELHDTLGAGWVTEREFEVQLHLLAAGLS